MERRGIIAWIALGLAGIALVAGVSLGASSLSGQKIGLASEPMSAGQSLAPTTPDTRAAEVRVARERARRRKARDQRRARARQRQRAAAAMTTAPRPPAAPSAPVAPAAPAPRVDDHGGDRTDNSGSGSDDGRNRGSGGSGDD